MHFALPPRKTSHPPPYARASRSSPIRRKQLQLGALVLSAVLLLIYLGTSLFKPGRERIPAGTADVVIVTVLDDATMSQDYIDRIVENRKYYAEKQGNHERLQESDLLKLMSCFCRIYDLLSQCQRL